MTVVSLLDRPRNLHRQTAPPSLRRADSNLLSFMARFFNRLPRQDTYSLSPAYYAMTGRKGLWVYGDEETLMVLARHPNAPEKLLLFPPLGKNPIGLLQSLLNEDDLPDGELLLARLGPDDTGLERHLGGLGFSGPATESLLDWTWPVHVLGVDAVCAHNGKGFRDFRKNINRTEKRHLQAEPIDIGDATHLEAIGKITSIWALHKSGYPFDDLVEPTQEALNLMQSGRLPLHGLLTYEHEHPIGFLIWEETDPERGIANSITGLSLGGKGTDEFAMLKMCECLQGKGFREVCIGGSETAGLDAFKRKMQPVRSIPLMSAGYRPDIPAIEPLSCASVSACAYGA